MKKVILTKGLPASGKTTWTYELMAKNPGKYKNVCKDDLRTMLDNWYWTPEVEKFITKTRDMLIMEALKDGYDVIVSDTNLNPFHVEHITEMVRDLATVEMKDFTDVPLEVCIERDRKRIKPVGYKVIRDFYYKYLAKPKPKIERNPNLPDAIICDLDGTLALIDGKRSPYDASKADEDDVNEPVAQLLHNYHKLGVTVIFVSGRKELYRVPTVKFLNRVGIKGDLYMRSNFLLDGKTEDNRKDWIVKKEIYDKYIKNNYNILFVLDDRSQVVQLCWRAMGLPCWQVNDGDF